MSAPGVDVTVSSFVSICVAPAIWVNGEIILEAPWIRIRLLQLSAVGPAEPVVKCGGEGYFDRDQLVGAIPSPGVLANVAR